ncbi:MAG TPA: 2-dehydropantoate 2-reductase N-terminal domain-containing protein [Ramlibacter sp.]|nr:2-dehydropantoate 2-reductase N-terminal domain-containing protein [Ramlibacter sp.]
MERILVWGAGAIGGTFGAYLVRAGHDVTFVDKVAEHVAAIRGPQRGLRITGPVDEFNVVAPAFTPEELHGRWDHVYLCVKGPDTIAAAQAILPHLGDDGHVVSLQNGLCEDRIASVVGRQRTIGAFINFGADWMGPGEIRYGNRAAFVVGELDGRITGRVQAVHATARDFEPDAVLTEDIHSYLWGKLGYVAYLYAQALGQKGIADCLDREELMPLWRRLGAEVNAVADALRIRPRGFNGYEPAAFGAGATDAEARRSVRAMADFNRPSGKTHSGGWRDLAVRRRKTEIEMIYHVVVHGKAQAVPTPAIERLVAMIHEIEDGRRAMSDENLIELMQAA